MPRVAVIILNWNGIKDTLSCLDSMNKQTYNDFKIIVVDNGSTDNSIDTLGSLPKQDNLTILYNEKNLGFAGGVNTGITWAIENNISHVALLNNDAVVEKDWLKSITQRVDDEEIGITTSLILHDDGKTIDSTGDFYSVWGIPSPRLRDEESTLAPDSGYVFGASGGASLYSVAMLKKIGVFDEDFFAYYEDVDISFRAQLAGYRVYYNKDAVVYHQQGASSSKVSGFTTVQAFKNLPLLFWKNVPLGLLVPIGARFGLIYTLMYFNAIRRGDGLYASRGLIKSIGLFWSSSLWKRFKIQRSKVVSTSYIRSIVSSELPPQSSLRKVTSVFKGAK
jgi:GT2 family glycosyltransferase